jgi:hypothetical protein
LIVRDDTRQLDTTISAAADIAIVADAIDWIDIRYGITQVVLVDEIDFGTCLRRIQITAIREVRIQFLVVPHAPTVEAVKVGIPGLDNFEIHSLFDSFQAAMRKYSARNLRGCLCTSARIKLSRICDAFSGIGARSKRAGTHTLWQTCISFFEYIAPIAFSTVANSLTAFAVAVAVQYAFAEGDKTSIDFVTDCVNSCTDVAIAVIGSRYTAVDYITCVIGALDPVITQTIFWDERTASALFTLGFRALYAIIVA